MELDIIYNEDCYSGIKKIPDKSVDLVYIDIPYLMTNGPATQGDLAQRIGKKFVELKGDKDKIEKLQAQAQELKNKMDNAKDKSEYEKWHSQRGSVLNRINLYKADITNGIDYSLFDELERVMKKTYIFIWCSKEQIKDIMNYWLSKPYKVNFNLLVWCKTNPTPATNNVWLPDLEYCLVFKQEGAPRYNDGMELKHKWYVSSANVKDKAKYEHPTIKPLDLVKQHILHTTQENDIVLDCFMGSGTTAVACKETGRHFIGFEINKEYYNIANDRLKGITKQDREQKERFYGLF